MAEQAQSPDNPAAVREGILTIGNLGARDPSRPDAATAQTGSPLVVSLRYSATREIPPVIFQLSYFSQDGRTLITRTETGAVTVSPPGGIVEFTCLELPLRPGAYCLTATVREAGSNSVISWWDGSTTLHVEPGVRIDGQFHVPHAWRAVSAAEDSAALPPRSRTR